MKSVRAIVPLSIALAALGCGGESQGGSVGVLSLGISSSEPLSALTAQDASSGCAKVQDALEAHFRQRGAKTAICTSLGLAVSATESACARLRDSCLQSDTGQGSGALDVSLDELDPAQDFECSGSNGEGWQGCLASVGELETCFNDLLSSIDELLSEYTCQDATPSQVDPSVAMGPPRLGGLCSAPPLDASGAVAIDPTTGQQYVDHRAECAAAAKRRMTPALPASCLALESECPNLLQSGD